MKTIHSRYKLFFLFVCLFTGEMFVHARPRPVRKVRSQREALSIRRRARKETPKTTLGKRLRARLRRRAEVGFKRSGMPQRKKIINRYKPSRLHRDVVYAKTLNTRSSSKKTDNQGWGFNLSRVFSTVYLFSTAIAVGYLLYKASNANNVGTNFSNNFQKTVTYKLLSGEEPSTNKYINYLLTLEQGFQSDEFYPWINFLPFPCLLSLSLISTAVITFVLWICYNIFIGGNNRVMPASSSQSIHLDINPDIHISAPPSQSRFQEKGIKAFIKDSVKKGIKEGVEHIKQGIENTKDDLKEIKEKLDRKKGRVIHIYPNSITTESSSDTKEAGLKAVNAEQEHRDDNALVQQIDTIAIPVEDDQDDFVIDDEQDGALGEEEDEGDQVSDLEDEDDEGHDVDEDEEKGEDDQVSGLDDEDDEEGDQDSFVIDDDQDGALREDEDEDDQVSGLDDEDDEESDEGHDEDEEEEDEDEDFAFLSAFSRT